ncbi:dephospho-CoA kinase [Coxiella endosymbiont of Ornithodoros amblus]|uniref:dephospho-CoA kinase n=1 Tax=Coxiella endosymbiont of Ornithodoros amblus TaxID=1656166 RepID=UPI00244DCE2C|nr:dephospho-CoA kinase [Coxiella endosymbiont of Ornithodoros amblus]MBW5802345.1 dephospho-CoA kinase [Coxiella endosymbiont of Ornithodoros amblus]
MLRIGLTGGIGSGKSTVASYFAELGAPVIDADQIVHEITKPDQEAFKQIVNYFGNVVLTKGKFLNRTKLRELIFENPNDRQWLEHLLHPIIIEKMKIQLKKIKVPYCILAIPLLAEASQSVDFIDRILVVDAPKTLQIQRTKSRDQLSDQQIQLILKSQNRREKRLAIADDVIVNDQTIPVLHKAVFQLHCKYLQIAQTQTTP